MSEHFKILFLNPRASKVFQAKAQDLAAQWSPSLIWTESSDIVQFYSDDHLVVQQIPRWACYNRSNYFTRVFSFVSYFVYAFTKVLFSSRRSLLFIVTTPPFLGMVGYVFKKIRRQKYVMLEYDIHPGALIGAGLIKDGLVAKLWRKFNRLILNNADAVITIGEYMAQKLEADYSPEKTAYGKTAVIHNWADVDWIKPLAKSENPFVQQYGLTDKFVILYSGNIGATHDMETLMEAARRLKDRDAIQFVIIGDGAKKQFVVESKEKFGLDNLRIMSYLPQEQLPYSLPSADVAIVTMSLGIEGYLVPCKFYTYLSAGNAVIGVCSDQSEVADIIRENQCGFVVRPGDADSLVAAILKLYEDRDYLQTCKKNSRNAAVQKYSRSNTQQYIDVISRIIPREA